MPKNYAQPSGQGSSPMELTPIPPAVAMTVGSWIELQRDKAREWDNVTFDLDPIMVVELHRLAARIYATGFNDGHAVGREECRGAQAASAVV